MSIRVAFGLFGGRRYAYTHSETTLAQFYLLNMASFVITKAPVEYFKDESLMYGMMEYRVGKNKMLFDVPPNIMKFYGFKDGYEPRVARDGNAPIDYKTAVPIFVKRKPRWEKNPIA